jgi:hypothetical protein
MAYPQHDFGISRTIRANSGDLPQVDAGSWYPALHGPEKQKWIGADGKISPEQTGNEGVYAGSYRTWGTVHQPTA